jgi:uncharacterized protein
MDPRKIIFDHYPQGSPLADMLIEHSVKVRNKALAIARALGDLNPDIDFIAEAAMLHDIGIGQTAARRIGCTGSLPYICHGVAGRELLAPYGLPLHGLVCERHVGAGITMADIQTQQLPLPLRDMVPLSLEETIICYADKFFSKKSGAQEHTHEEILRELAPYGQDKVQRFLLWHGRFNPLTDGQTVRSTLHDSHRH